MITGDRLKSFLFALASPIWIAQAAPAASEAIGSDRAPRELTVATNGTGHFTSVQAAVDAVPDHHPKQHVIKIHPGSYREVITLKRSVELTTNGH